MTTRYFTWINEIIPAQIDGSVDTGLVDFLMGTQNSVGSRVGLMARCLGLRL
jgi:hypothetical protein